MNNLAEVLTVVFMNLPAVANVEAWFREALNTEISNHPEHGELERLKVLPRSRRAYARFKLPEANTLAVELFNNAPMPGHERLRVKFCCVYERLARETVGDGMGRRSISQIRSELVAQRDLVEQREVGPRREERRSRERQMASVPTYILPPRRYMSVDQGGRTIDWDAINNA